MPLIENIYIDPILKYPLTEDEYKFIDKIWKFLEIFERKFIFISDYRNHVIRKVIKRYTLEDFYTYESIANKLFWNLRWMLFPLWEYEDMDKENYDKYIEDNYGGVKEIPNSLLLCKSITYKDELDIKDKINEAKQSLYHDNYYRSFINKLIIVDKKDKIIYFKPIEGSSEIFSKNYFNLYTSTILLNRKKYERIMNNPYRVKTSIKVPVSDYYYQYDYGFPNLNLCAYTFGTKEQRIDRIKRMYYSVNPKAQNWFKLIV